MKSRFSAPSTSICGGPVDVGLVQGQSARPAAAAYEHNDEAGDLRTFLSLPAGTFDELKQAIDDFPTIFDVDHCDERFLPLLARLVGLEVDGTCSPDCQRRRVREAVEV